MGLERDFSRQALSRASRSIVAPSNVVESSRSVIGFAELLIDDKVGPDSPHHHEFLGYILTSGRHLLQLINEVLDLAKVESGTMEFRPEPLNLSQVIAEVCDVVGLQSSAKLVQLACSVDPSVNQLTLDPARLRQVLYNYVSNAIKFSKSGATVRICAHPLPPDMVRLEVIDTGVGISASNLGRLFVEFQQLDDGPGKTHPGTGLGLALTRRLVEAQGGAVGVQSELGRGALFFAELPCHSAVIARSSRPRPPRPSLERSVLVVENDDRQRRGVVQVLEAAGFQVETASNGAQAAMLTADRQFEAITLALLLPDLTGLEVLHRLRQTEANRETPIVLIGVEAEGGAPGGFSVHDYLRMPILGPELLASLTHAGVLPNRSGVVLVMDDDLASRKLMAATLVLLGYQVVCSEDCGDALAIVERTHPLAVILDFLMPNHDAISFLTRLRKLRHGRHLPAIIWTSKDLTAVERRKIAALAQGVFSKGDGRPKALLDELQALVGARRRPRPHKRGAPPQRDARPR